MPPITGCYGPAMHLGLVGCGRWGRLILRDLNALGCSVSVVARSPESRQRAMDGDAAAIVESVDALGDVSGIVVATPTATHAQVVLAVLDRGVPVFVEKPLTDDPVSAGEIVQRAGDQVFVMDKWRYHPGIEALGELRRSGELGPLMAITTRRLSWGHSHDDVDAVWILLPHDLSIVQEIAGYIPDAMYAVGWRGDNRNAAIVAVLGPAPSCVLEVSSISPHRERRIVAQFAGAVAVLDDSYAGALRIRPIGGNEGDTVSRPISSEMPLERELRTFVEHLRGGPVPRTTAAEALVSVQRIAELRTMAGI